LFALIINNNFGSHNNDLERFLNTTSEDSNSEFRASISSSKRGS
jgi:hypothetical protein